MSHPCEIHRTFDYAGVYKRNKYGKLLKQKRGKHAGDPVLLPENETWACPYCNVVFVKPKSIKNFKTRPLKRKTQHVINNRTVSRASR